MKKNILNLAISALLLSVVMSPALHADDIDVYHSKRVLPYSPNEHSGTVFPPNPNYPNIMFILDASWSMGHNDQGQVGTRLERMRQAVNTVLAGVKYINIGLMRLSHRESGGRVLYPLSPIEYARDEIGQVVDNLSLDWYTPAIGALLEGAYYYSGAPVFYGKSRTRYIGDKRHYAERYTRLSHPDSYTGGNIVRDSRCKPEDLDHPSCISERIDGNPVYRTPILDSCQKNIIVLVTDGAATRNVDMVAAEGLVGSCVSDESDTCGVEIARFLSTQDQAPDVAGVNTVITHTVGFNVSLPSLERIAAAGQGKYYQSNSAEELADALLDVVSGAGIPSVTLAKPSVSIDPDNRFANRKDVYLTLFQPLLRPLWRGNLKGYWFDGELKDYSTPRIAAIDPASGLMSNNAKSRWSGVVDGANVELGGAASQIKGHRSRRIVTNHPKGSKQLLAAKNRLVVNNIVTADVGLPDPTLRLQAEDFGDLLSWVRGVDVLDVNRNGNHLESRRQYGDPLHSNPVVVTYGKRAVDKYESVVYFGTNEGFIHAVDALTGSDIYSFMPWQLLGNLKHSFVNRPYGEKLYGMDGYLTSWTADRDGNGFVDSSDEHAYLYAGMRRGGRNYYALDVSEKNSPELMWRIQGGVGEFKELGQSWSKMVRSKMVHPATGDITDVLVFSGGYDERQDDTTSRMVDEVGRAIYIVEAKTGKYVWHAAASAAMLNVPSMQYSIPATPAVVDINGDGLFDQIYAADMGGQVWRFDAVGNGQIQGGVIANLATSAHGNRRFYSSPDVALVRSGKGRAYLTVSLGSGARARPLDRSQQNRFYVLKQTDVHRAPAGYGVMDYRDYYKPLTHGNLVDVTQNLIVEGDAVERDTTEQQLEEKHGWYIDLRSGEKVLNPSITVDNKIVYTSYIPGSSSNSSSCSVDPGKSRLYVLDIFNGGPVLDQNGDGRLLSSDRHVTLVTAGISAPPSVMFSATSTGGTQVNLVVGSESRPLATQDLTGRTYWSEISDF